MVQLLLGSFPGGVRLGGGVRLAMTTTTIGVTGSPDQRGSALVSVLLLLMMMSALAAALAVSGRTETLVARNHQSAAQARVAAEAGVNHAVEVASAYLFQWKAHGYSSVDDAIDGLLADHSVLEPQGLTLGTRIHLSSTIEYETFIMDEDDPARGGDATDLTGDSDPLNDEDGNAATDNNLKLIVRAVGYAQGHASAVVEAVIAPLALPAVLANGNLDISGNPTIDGTDGSVHTNADLTMSGNPAVYGDATSSGMYDDSGHPTVGGATGGGRPVLPVPAIRASDYLIYADYILTADGQMTLPNGSVLCDASAKKDTCKKDYGVDFKDDGKGWEIKGKDVASGTYYVRGEVKIHDPGSGKKEKAQISVIAEGSIEVHGNNRELTPDTTDLLFVTDGDLKITGGSDIAMTVRGQILVHEQLEISGHPELLGQILVEDAPSVDKTATDNSISGNPTITYNGGLGTSYFTVTGWRETR